MNTRALFLQNAISTVNTEEDVNYRTIV